MKRTVLVGALVAALSVAACTPPPASNSNQPANSNSSANRNAAASPTPAVAFTEAQMTEIKNREQQTWEAIKNKDWDAFGGMLADEYLLIIDSGIYDKTATIDGLKPLTFTSYTLSDHKVVSLGPDAYVVTYMARSTGTDDEGRPFPDTSSYESSAWVKRGDKWLALYHQDSEVQTAPESGTTASPTPAPPDASAATPAPSPAPDAKTREQQIWDLLKAKNWDAFASFVADNQLEVESNGVHDKAGTLNGVKQTDFTGATLSDFQERTLTPNATLITYLVKGGSGPLAGAGMRHTTIWVNNGGRWLATFHQGTTVKQ
jgi:hypothetical protein